MLQPQTVQLSFRSSPVGLVLGVGTKAPHATPFTVTEIKGSAITVNASQDQTLDGTAYTYRRWSDGGVQNHTLTASASATYTATYVFTATFHALPPTRLLDTRSGTGLSGSFKSHHARAFQVTGRGGVPVDAVAVTGNLTITRQTGGGYLFVGPDPQNNPTSSTLNVPLGDTRANGLTVALSPAGTLSATFVGSSSATAQVVFDVTGYFTADGSGSTFHALPPTRLLDTRSGTGLSGSFKSHHARAFQVTGRGGVPVDAVAVTGNLTITRQTGGGYLFVGPDPQNNPTSSTLNVPLGDTRANGLTVALSPAGTLSATFVGVLVGDGPGPLRRDRLLHGRWQRVDLPRPAPDAVARHPQRDRPERVVQEPPRTGLPGDRPRRRPGGRGRRHRQPDDHPADRAPATCSWGQTRRTTRPARPSTSRSATPGRTG